MSILIGIHRPPRVRGDLGEQVPSVWRQGSQRQSGVAKIRHMALYGRVRLVFSCNLITANHLIIEFQKQLMKTLDCNDVSNRWSFTNNGDTRSNSPSSSPRPGPEPRPDKPVTFGASAGFYPDRIQNI